jgi:DNA primase
MRYRACIKERETIPHKQILYSRQEHWTERIIVVEGPTDVWRMGVHSVATSGIQFTPQQVRVLSHFKQVHILYDPEHEAQIQAARLASELRFRNVETHIHVITEASDPGKLAQTDADYIVKQLIK